MLLRSPKAFAEAALNRCVTALLLVNVLRVGQNHIIFYMTVCSVISLPYIAILQIYSYTGESVVSHLELATRGCFKNPECLRAGAGAALSLLISLPT